MKVLKLVSAHEEELQTADAAAYLGLRPRTLIKKIGMGEGPRHTRRFGRLWFKPSDLKAFKEEHSDVREAYS